MPPAVVRHGGDVSTIVMVAQTHPADFEAFTAFEDRFVELFGHHGLVLRHRFRDERASSEIHVIDVLRPDSLDSYFADPRRAALQEGFSRLRVEQRVHTVTDMARIDS